MSALRGLMRAVLALCCALTAVPALAHENLPIVIDLRELTPGHFALKTRLPANIEPSAAPTVSLGPPCRLLREGNTTTLFACPQDVRPAAIVLAYPEAVPASALLLRTEMIDGTMHAAVSPPGSTRLDLPQAETPWGVIASYVGIGVEHIALGADHLLFLVLLVLVAGTLRRTITTVTGFTAGHALTITLATLGMVHVDAAAVEALIALSIVFVAVELARGQADTLLSRHPALVAAGFGTLHGLGFAGALAEIGLARTSMTLSLVGFNLGVEIGQTAFVLLVFGAIVATRRLAARAEAGPVPHLRIAAISTIGIAASFWFWERSFAILA
ncbi:HupE/UreJ family protein [Croceicoccus sp. BE223]|uniref:HupE/UreJ family protein n=1 Tax=Croceicoccus sp. BE223 TaxID=2817716 RepID=UPI0028592F8E|nr:HupE/UreJ family protein [Croceicoccus sp. BE223]MDR7103638.1 hypothetical protein [Croceicoccus sp. BE223]